MGLTLVTPPTVWPVTLDEAKAQCRVRHSDEDGLLDRLIAAAIGHIEKELSISIAEQTWELSLDAFSDAIELRRGPVISVTSVKYSDADGIEQTVSASDYTTDFTSERPWVVLNSDASWPDTLDGINAVRVRYVAGMAIVPPSLKHAALVGIQRMFERGADPRSDAELERAFESLLQPFRRVLV